jgi:hypothetical protein
MVTFIFILAFIVRTVIKQVFSIGSLPYNTTKKQGCLLIFLSLED